MARVDWRRLHWRTAGLMALVYLTVGFDFSAVFGPDSTGVVGVIGPGIAWTGMTLFGKGSSNARVPGPVATWLLFTLPNLLGLFAVFESALWWTRDLTFAIWLLVIGVVEITTFACLIVLLIRKRWRMARESHSELEGDPLAVNEDVGSGSSPKPTSP